MTVSTKVAPTAVLLAVLVLVTSALTGSWARPALSALSLTRHAERYTSIEFVESLTPLLSRPAGTPLAVTVRVGNHQGAGTGYALTSSLVDKSGSALAERQQRTFTLGDGATIDLPVVFALPECTGRVRVDVALTGRPQALRAWLNLQSSDAGVKACE